MTVPLTEAEIKELAATWYRKLDVHAPMVEVLPMLAEEGLEMKFPEKTLHDYAEFEWWFQRVIRIFFDEVHTLKEVKANVSGDKADVKVVVKWEASLWNPPAAKSERIVLDAYQTWVVTRSPTTQKPVIRTYIVDSLDYAPGSARL
jgi:hypothetical protein